MRWSRRGSKCSPAMANWNISDIVVVVDPFAKCTRGEASDPFHGAGRGRSWGIASDGGCGDSWLHSTGQTSVCVSLSPSLSLLLCVYVVGLSLVNSNDNNNDCHWNWPLKWRLGGFWLLFWLVLYVNCCPSVAAAGKTICDLRSLLLLLLLLLCVYYLRHFLANETIWMCINFNPQQNKLDSINRSHAASAQQLSLSLSAIWTPIESRFCYFALHTHRYTYLHTHTIFSQSLITRWIADLSTESWQADKLPQFGQSQNLWKSKVYRICGSWMNRWISDNASVSASAIYRYDSMRPIIYITLRWDYIFVI